MKLLNIVKYRKTINEIVQMILYFFILYYSCFHKILVYTDIHLFKQYQKIIQF